MAKSNCQIMKNLLVWRVLVSGGHLCYAQDTIFTYFNPKWEPGEKEDACYTREGWWGEDSLYHVIDRYITGERKMTGSYLTAKCEIKQGLFVYYFLSGGKQEQISYVDDHPVGSYKSWDLSGEVDGSYDETGQKMGRWMAKHDATTLSYEGSYLGGKREGEWKWYHKNGQLSAFAVFQGGDLRKATYWNEKGKQIKGTLEYQEPQPKNMRSVQRAIGYPEEARNAGVEGIIMARVLVDEKGRYVKHKFPCPAPDILKTAVSKELPKLRFIPALLEGNRKTKFWVNIPFEFKLLN